MDIMFWIWLGVIIVTAIVEFATMEVVSIWFTFGAVVPLILSATKAVNWEIQIIIFVVISAVLIVSLRGVTKKFLQKNSEGRTNLETLIGQKYRMLSRTDFETMGSLKVNDVVWTAIGDEQQTIEKDEVVEVVRIKGNKLLVRKADKGDKAGAGKKKIEKVDAKTEKTENNLQTEVEQKSVQPAKSEKEEQKISQDSAKTTKKPSTKTSSAAKQSKESTPKAGNTKNVKTSSKETEVKKSSSKSGAKTANNSSKSKNTSKNAVKSSSNATTKKSTSTKNSTAKTTKSSTAKKKVNK